MTDKSTLLLATFIVLCLIDWAKRRYHWRLLKATNPDLKYYGSPHDFDIRKPEEYWKYFFITFKLLFPSIVVKNKKDMAPAVRDLAFKSQLLSISFYVALAVLLAGLFI